MEAATYFEKTSLLIYVFRQYVLTVNIVLTRHDINESGN